MRFGFRVGCISSSSALMGQLLRPISDQACTRVRSPYTTSWEEQMDRACRNMKPQLRRFIRKFGFNDYNYLTLIANEVEGTSYIYVRMRFGLRVGCISSSSALMVQLLRPTRKYGVRSSYTTSWFFHSDRMLKFKK